MKAQTGWSIRITLQRQHLPNDHPVCAASEASRLFLTGAATPLFQEGNALSWQFIHTFYGAGFSWNQRIPAVIDRRYSKPVLQHVTLTRSFDCE